MMKIIISEIQSKRLLNEIRIDVLQKLVDSQITNDYDLVCKIDITPPHYYNKQYSAHVYFKDVDIMSMNIPNYFKMKEEIMDEVWHLIYDFTGETVSLYKHNC
jgi:hypothetical protein